MSSVIKINSNSNVVETFDSTQSIIPKMLDFHYYSELTKLKHENERRNISRFNGYSDVDMIYYFIHEQKNLDESKNKSERTKEEYLKEILHFTQNILKYQEQIGIDINEIKEGSLFKSLEPRHLENYQTWYKNEAPKLLRNKESFAATTIAKKDSIIKGFFRFLFEKKYIEQEITIEMKTTSVKKEELPNRDLGPAQVLELLNYLKEIDHPIMFGIVHVLVTTGIRNIEFCKLKVRDLKRNYNTNDYFLNVDGKGNKHRTVVIKPKVYESIVAFRKMRGLSTKLSNDDNSYLFTTSTGNRYTPSYLADYIKKFILRLPLDWINELENPITPHTFRHAYAIISHYSGADIYDISRSLGHEQISTTTIYLSKVFEQERNAIHHWHSGALKDYI